MLSSVPAVLSPLSLFIINCPGFNKMPVAYRSPASRFDVDVSDPRNIAGSVGRRAFNEDKRVLSGAVSDVFWNVYDVSLYRSIVSLARKLTPYW